MAEARCSVFKQPAMIAASAPIDRTDIAFIICFLVHKEAGVYRVALSEANRNQDPASCHEPAISDELRPKAYRFDLSASEATTFSKRGSPLSVPNEA